MIRQSFTVAKSSPRLLIINNMPAYYRTAPFAALIAKFSEATEGGSGRVMYQVRRDPARRGEWFFTPDDQLPYDHRFLSPAASASHRRTGYPLRFAARDWAEQPPTHVLVAGWDSPLSWLAAIWGRVPRARVGMWVESNLSTSRHQGRLIGQARKSLLAGVDFVLVPTSGSGQYVESLAKRSVPALQLLNPVAMPRLPDEDDAGQGKRLVFLGDLSGRKGFDVLCAVLSAGEADGWTGVAWGRDVEGRASAAPANLEVMESRPIGQILPSLRSTDILVIPSRVDPAPLTFSEGLALGIRTIVSDTIAYGEVAHGIPGCARAQGADADSYLAAANALFGEERPSATAGEQVSPAFWADRVTDWLLGRTC